MKKNRILVAIMAIIILMSTLTGCSREGRNPANASYIGARSTSTDTVSATLTNSTYPTGVTLNWSKRVGNSAVTATGLQTLTFVLDGDEVMDGLFTDRKLDSITLTLTGKSSGKTVTMSTSLAGKISNLGVDSSYFKLENNSLQFYPHYFTVGEDVVINAVFTYKGDGVMNQIFDEETAEGFFTFTVGESTGETFAGPLDGVGDLIDGVINPGNGNNGNAAENFITVNCNIDGKDTVVYHYQEDAEANPIIASSTVVPMTFFTRELAGHNITKVYIVPVGYEDTLEKMAWNNDYYSDNCHKFRVNFQRFAGMKVTIRVEFLDGAEWNPMPDHYYGYVTVIIPEW